MAKKTYVYRTKRIKTSNLDNNMLNKTTKLASNESQHKVKRKKGKVKTKPPGFRFIGSFQNFD